MLTHTTNGTAVGVTWDFFTSFPIFVYVVCLCTVVCVAAHARRPQLRSPILLIAAGSPVKPRACSRELQAWWFSVLGLFVLNLGGLV